MNPKAEVSVYSRTGCHLCERVLEQLRPLTASLNFELEEILIDGDTELEKEFGEIIPVTKINGQYVDHFSIDLDKFKTYLEKYRQHR